jgi:regulator of ribosome biosynthesis
MLMCTDVDYDLAKEARVKRKDRVAKNERQQMQNVAQAAGTGTGARKRDIDRTLAMTRTSTASMGKFDRVLDGEKKLRGVKRKVPYRPTFLRLRSLTLLRL